jgi:hypothetical protein
LDDAIEALTNQSDSVTSGELQRVFQNWIWWLEWVVRNIEKHITEWQNKILQVPSRYADWKGIIIFDTL